MSAMEGFQVTHALSLTQPWASLVAIGSKRYETRSWRTGYRGWVAIHAAKGFPRECQALCYQQPFAACLAGAGFDKPGDLPRGEVLAIVKLADCISTNHWTPTGSIEYDFGDYGANRYAWELQDVHPLAQTFPARGMLNLWKLPRALGPADLA